MTDPAEPPVTEAEYLAAKLVIERYQLQQAEELERLKQRLAELREDRD